MICDLVDARNLEASLAIAIECSSMRRSLLIDSDNMLLKIRRSLRRDKTIGCDSPSMPYSVALYAAAMRVRAKKIALRDLTCVALAKEPVPVAVVE
jgi:hypothetical protein